MSVTYDEIIAKIKSDEYCTQLTHPGSFGLTQQIIFDNNPDKTVQWCIEEFNRQQDVYNAALTTYKKDSIICENQFEKDVIQYMLGFVNKLNQVRIAFNFAWDHCHSFGYLSVLNCVDELLQILIIEN